MLVIVNYIIFFLSSVISSRSNSKLTVDIDSNNCGKKIKFLEHVEITLTLSFKPRGNLEIALYSPKGTFSRVMGSRPKDKESIYFDWTFTSVHFWGESPKGKWKLQIVNKGERVKINGNLIRYRLTFHGF